MRILFFLLPMSLCALTLQEKQVIGERIWKNESNRTEKGLTSWNAGEAFASMGIGHFIWFPEGCKSPFQETFPSLLFFLREKGVEIPLWAMKGCPWGDREAFYRDFDGAKLEQMRSILASTVALQAEYIVDRFGSSMQNALVTPKIKRAYERLIRTPQGVFAMIDYLNFKGDGLSEKERYQGVGWGLMQVLAEMGEAHKDPVCDFIASAKKTLERRVELSAPERDEKRWLPGWFKRIESYRGT